MLRRIKKTNTNNTPIIAARSPVVVPNVAVVDLLDATSFCAASAATVGAIVVADDAPPVSIVEDAPAAFAPAATVEISVQEIVLNLPSVPQIAKPLPLNPSKQLIWIA